MKKLILTTAVCALLSGAALAEQSPWLIRAHAVGLDMSNKDSTGLSLSVNNKTIPEIDISYFINKNVAVELILTVPQKQTVNSTALGIDIGTFKHLPPVITLQYHFDNFADFKTLCRRWRELHTNHTSQPVRRRRQYQQPQLGWCFASGY